MRTRLGEPLLRARLLPKCFIFTTYNSSFGWYYSILQPRTLSYKEVKQLPRVLELVRFVELRLKPPGSVCLAGNLNTELCCYLQRINCMEWKRRRWKDQIIEVLHARLSDFISIWQPVGSHWWFPCGVGDRMRAGLWGFGARCSTWAGLKRD